MKKIFSIIQVVLTLVLSVYMMYKGLAYLLLYPADKAHIIGASVFLVLSIFEVLAAAYIAANNKDF